MSDSEGLARLRARHLLTEIRRRANDSVLPALGDYGIVSAVSGSLVAVQLAGDPDAGTQLLARAAGPDIVPGDTVVLVPMRGGGSVAFKIGGAEVTAQSLSPFSVRYTGANAFLVEDGGGGDIFSIETNGASLAVRVENGTPLRGYADGAQATLEWEIDANGRANFTDGLEVDGVSLLGGSIQGARHLYMTNVAPAGTLAGVTLTANRVYYVPVYAPRGLSCDAFTFEITTAVSGSVQCGLYTCLSTFLPDARIVLGTKTAQSTTGVKVQTHTAVGVTGGRWYWVALCSTVAMAVKGTTTSGALISPRGGAASTTNYCMASEDLAAGWSNLPASASPGSLGDTYIHVGARAA